MQAVRNLLHLSLALAAYLVILIASQQWLKASAPLSPLREILALTPMLPGLALAWVVMQALRHMDELQRKIQFDAFALAFLATATLTFSYGFLEGAGFPKLSMFVVWPVLATFWALGTFIGQWRYR